MLTSGPAAAQILAGALDATVHPEADPARTAARSSTPARTSGSGRALVALADAGVAVSDFSFGQPSLDEAFLALTGQPSGATIEEVQA